jgi:hypothetical protein
MYRDTDRETNQALCEEKVLPLVSYMEINTSPYDSVSTVVLPVTYMIT